MTEGATADVDLFFTKLSVPETIPSAYSFMMSPSLNMMLIPIRSYSKSTGDDATFNSSAFFLAAFVFCCTYSSVSSAFGGQQ